MHRDMKVGLALAVLLVGVVAAFFFRNEPVGHKIPELENPDRLDDQIAEMTFTPYLTGVESDVKSKVKETRTGSELNPFATTSDNISTESQSPIKPPSLPDDWEIPDFLKDPDDADLTKTSDRSHMSGLKTAPDPIQVEDKKTKSASPLPVPAHNNAWNVATNTKEGGKPDRQTLSRPVSNSTVRSPQFQVHRVQKGDTLSGLSARYLGSSARFLELYNVNRDILKSPNDLRIGMEIKIPPRINPGSATTPGKNSNSKNQNPTSEPSGRRFVPFRRHPFRPTTPDNRSTRLEKEPKPEKRLSQTPPPDLPAINEELNPNDSQPEKSTLDDPIPVVD